MYESDLTKFIREFLTQHPEEIESQRRGRAIWWVECITEIYLGQYLSFIHADGPVVSSTTGPSLVGQPIPGLAPASWCCTPCGEITAAQPAAQDAGERTVPPSLPSLRASGFRRCRVGEDYRRPVPPGTFRLAPATMRRSIPAKIRLCSGYSPYQ